MRKPWTLKVWATAVATLLVLGACGDGADDGEVEPEETAPTAAEVDTGPSEELLVVATTTILGDLVKGIVGDDATVTVLLPVGADPHDYQPSSRDGVTIREADLVVANGLALEESLIPVLEAAHDDGARILEVGDMVDPMEWGEGRDPHEGEDDDHMDDEGRPRPHGRRGRPRPHGRRGRPRPHGRRGRPRPHGRRGRPRPHGREDDHDHMDDEDDHDHMDDEDDHDHMDDEDDHDHMDDEDDHDHMDDEDDHDHMDDEDDHDHMDDEDDHDHMDDEDDHDHMDDEDDHDHMDDDDDHDHMDDEDDHDHMDDEDDHDHGSLRSPLLVRSLPCPEGRGVDRRRVGGYRQGTVSSRVD